MLSDNNLQQRTRCVPVDREPRGGPHPAEITHQKRPDPKWFLFCTYPAPIMHLSCTYHASIPFSGGICRESWRFPREFRDRGGRKKPPKQRQKQMTEKRLTKKYARRPVPLCFGELSFCQIPVPVLGRSCLHPALILPLSCLWSAFTWPAKPQENATKTTDFKNGKNLDREGAGRRLIRHCSRY